jgi:hypothetical protein
VRKNYTLEDFIKNVHKFGYTFVDYNSIRVPIIYIDNVFFEQILNFSYNKRLSIDTNLNIYDDGYHVFVDITLKFLNTNKEETFLLYANESLEFFYSLATAGIFGLSSKDNQSSNVFFIQLPKKDKAEKAYDLIKDKLKESKDNAI